jgi:hypothetical protein
MIPLHSYHPYKTDQTPIGQLEAAPRIGFRRMEERDKRLYPMKAIINMHAQRLVFFFLPN